MKKSILLSIILPLAAVTLSGCVKYNGKGKDGKGTTSDTTTETPTDTSTSTSEDPVVPPAPEGQINIYFVLGPNGSFEGETPTTVAAKFLDNTVIKTVDRGSALPGATKIKSSITGSNFLHWIDRSSTAVVTTAPDAPEAILVAVFEGGQGANPSSYDDAPSVSEEVYGFVFDLGNNKHNYVMGVKGADWSEDGKTWQQFVISDLTFVKDQRFQLFDFKNKAAWTVVLNSYSCGSDVDTYFEIVGTPGTSSSYYKVKKDWKVKEGVYIKLLYQNDQVYIG